MAGKTRGKKTRHEPLQPGRLTTDDDGHLNIPVNVYEEPTDQRKPNGKLIVETYVELSCRHTIRIKDTKENSKSEFELHCPGPCNVRLVCGHTCSKFCFERCERCRSLSIQECDLGHKYVIPCADIDTNRNICKVQIWPEQRSACGHSVLIPCGRRADMVPNMLTSYCQARCEAELEKEDGGCGHVCEGTCQECQQGRFHVRCSKPCGRTLICSHVCTTPCSQACPPCSADCEKMCEHGGCKEQCGIPCEPCQEPCVWACPHYKCTAKCGEICDRPPCREPCPKTLPCGHPCISYCGDPCPSLCRSCNKAELESGLLGYKEVVGSEDRFILLQDCGHAVEEELLEGWMNVHDPDGEISPKTCPICRSMIHRCRRYVGLLTRLQVDIQAIKKRIYGDPEAIAGLQKESYEILLTEGLHHNEFLEFKEYLAGLLYTPGPGPSVEYKKLNLKEMESLRYMSKIWLQAESQVSALREQISEAQYEALMAAYKRLFWWLSDLQVPLQPREFRDVRRQVDRFLDFGELYARRTESLSQSTKYLFQTSKAVAAFGRAHSILWSWAPYDEKLKAQYQRALKELDEATNCTLGITDAERLQIIHAIDLTPGRWFKCPNGHIYLVTECGGATEKARCSECGLVIGGIQHRLEEGNTLATEMDGARLTAYPNADH